ncbi:MAG: ABC transporter ATP-binding protein [Rhabdochlamydiaceae bacterium]
MSEPIVEFSHVDSNIQNKKILSDLSFCIRRGEKWAVVGPNGSGKTTLLRIVNGYLRPSCGSASVLGDRFGDGSDLGEMRKKTAFVRSYLDNLLESQDNVLDIVVSGKYGATRLWQVPPYEIVERARKLMRQLGCGKFENRSLSELSQGERQKILIARSLMSDSMLLTFDEPCASLDLGTKESFLRGVETIARKRKELAMIYVTHRIDEIPSCFTHALLLNKGRIVGIGRIDQTLNGSSLSRCFGVKVSVKRWRRRLYPVVLD